MQNKQNGEIGLSHANEATGTATAPAPATSILIVEDDENISTAIQEYFSRAGYAVTTASDGVAGIDAASKARPDVVVLDLMLPKLDGLAVCKELRLKSPQMPIIMLTAKDDVVDKVLGLEMARQLVGDSPRIHRERGVQASLGVETGQVLEEVALVLG